MLKKIFLVLVVLIIIALIAAVALFYVYQGMLEAPRPEAVDEEIIVDIPSGAGTQSIAAILYREGLIENELAFRIYVTYHDLAQGFIAGQYILNPAMNVEKIVDTLHSGEVYSETAWFTIPEGFTVEEIAARLEEKKLADKEKFLALTEEPPGEIVESFPFLADVDQTALNYLLEGYLFPDTYEVYSDADEVNILYLMLGRTNQIFNEQYRERIAEMDTSIHEILTIASLIEREARVDHERSTISSVIYNRLAINQLLQIDATIQYILGETKEFLTYDDLEVVSPFNTYQNPGLPPGPIAAPGHAAIEAALYPEDTDYYYYNYKYDDTGEHYFSHTYEEHLENVRKAEENLR